MPRFKSISANGFTLHPPSALKATEEEKVNLLKQRGFGPTARTTIIRTNNQDDKALDKKEDAAGVGGNSNKKVMVDGKTNSFNEAKIAKSKSDFNSKTEAEKKEMQEAADKKRKVFEQSDEYKKRKSPAKKKRIMGQYTC